MKLYPKTIKFGKITSQTLENFTLMFELEMLES